MKLSIRELLCGTNTNGRPERPFGKFQDRMHILGVVNLSQNAVLKKISKSSKL